MRLHRNYGHGLKDLVDPSYGSLVRKSHTEDGGFAAEVDPSGESSNNAPT